MNSLSDWKMDVHFARRLRYRRARHPPVPRQLDHARHVGGPEEELRAIVGEEGRVPSPLLLGEDVNLALELRRGLDAPRLADHLPAKHLVTLHTPQQEAHGLAGAPLLEGLLLHAPCHHSAPPLDAENV